MISAAGSTVSALQAQDKVLGTALDILGYPAVRPARIPLGFAQK